MRALRRELKEPAPGADRDHRARRPCAPVIHTLMAEPFPVRALPARRRGDRGRPHPCARTARPPQRGGAPGRDGRPRAADQGDLAADAIRAEVGALVAAQPRRAPDRGGGRGGGAGGSVRLRSVPPLARPRRGRLAGREAVRAARRAPVAPLWRRPGRERGRRSLSHGRGQENSRHPGVSASCSSSTSRSTGSASPTGSPCCCRSGGRILRIKGLLNVAGDPLPRVLQCVQHSVYPASSLPAWPVLRPTTTAAAGWCSSCAARRGRGDLHPGQLHRAAAAPRGLKGRISAAARVRAPVPPPASRSRGRLGLLSRSAPCTRRRCSPRPPPRTPTWCDARGGGRSRSRRSRG